MKVISLSDNISTGGCCCEHGLSLYIELDRGPKILFDTGQSGIFIKNAALLGVDIASVDMAVISHGHYDHGGGLAAFLEVNSTAPVYIRDNAFEPHWSLRSTGTAFIGLDASLSDNERIRPCGPRTTLPGGITLFSDVEDAFPRPEGSLSLLSGVEMIPDDFSHEQSLLIEENGRLFLFGGCAHRGIVNIIRRAEEITGRTMSYVLSGMHLSKGEQSREYLERLSEELLSRPGCTYYTMHCTGQRYYDEMKSLLGERLHYLACGETVSLISSISSRFAREMP